MNWKKLGTRGLLYLLYQHGQAFQTNARPGRAFYMHVELHNDGPFLYPSPQILHVNGKEKVKRDLNVA
jgi:hypothetical protein